MAMCCSFAGIWAGTEWQSLAARLQGRPTSLAVPIVRTVQRPRGRSANVEQRWVLAAGGLVLCSAT
jgi:hypothetical protein